MSDAALATMEAELIGKVLHLVDQIEEKTQRLHAAVARGLPFLPPPMRMQATGAWQEFCDEMTNYWNFWRDVFANMGSPSQLKTIAYTWSDRVGSPVSSQVQAVDAGQLTVDDNWDGDAAKAYRDLLPAQKDALTQIKATLTDAIGDSLNSIADAIRVFWGTMIATCVPLVGGLIGAIGASGTIIGIPAAVVAVLGAVITASIGMNIAIAMLKSSSESASSKLRQKLGEDTAFGGGQWPPTATGGPPLR
ncbi:hypothetical protein GCM10010168_46130 [Actinoplanes ianthinogenes]|uniref:Uncharacterized protein n=1 Tax=Actinoplanes ianthinogenes TaxID=122358 RepID=A0ABM7LP80_9ACTN|nr:WXG100 family type VII secretion target [Actinoplanes ianthinogenes]BCJ41089.1 hypothetical protein Aiant_17460 [Actinoplanes ianthinogenes]GGR22973.1 hypothetical protein GCM10010168_46130 [Actinoplanes ianthinogenes]